MIGSYVPAGQKLGDRVREGFREKEEPEWRRSRERQLQMAQDGQDRSHLLGSPPSAPFPKGPGATHPLSWPLGLFPHLQVALPNPLTRAWLHQPSQVLCRGPPD